MLRIRRTCRVLLVFLALIIWTGHQGLATTIVAIRTPELIVIAADSAGTFKGGGADTQRSVSKIFHTNGVLYALAGIAYDIPRGFRPERIIAASLKFSRSLLSAVENFENIVTDALREELLKVQGEDPDLFQYFIRRNGARTKVVLASFEGGQPIAIAIDFVGTVSPEGKIVVEPHRLACSGDCPNGIYTFVLGEQNAIKKYVAEHGERFSMSPEAAAKFMVQLEIDAKTPGVAPPIEVFRLNKNGIRRLDP